jgi:hypothetical protein
MTRPTLVFKKTHTEQCGNQTATSRMAAIYSGRHDSSAPIVTDDLLWVMFGIQTISLSTRFVLIAAGESTWSKGWDALRQGITVLIHEFSREYGPPSVCFEHGDDVPSQPSLWFLQTPDNQYHMIAYEPKLDAVHLNPVVSINPDVPSGSLEALRLLFPTNADQGIEALSTFFADPALPSAPLP